MRLKKGKECVESKSDYFTHKPTPSCSPRLIPPTHMIRGIAKTSHCRFFSPQTCEMGSFDYAAGMWSKLTSETYFPTAHTSADGLCYSIFHLN